MNASRSRPWLMPLILGFSLGCNALLGGFVATQQVRSLLTPQPVEQPAAPRPGLLIRAMISRLPADDAAVMRAAFREHALQIAAAQRNVLLALQRVRAVLSDQALDNAALEQSMTAARQARQEFGALLQQILIEALEHLSPEGRRAVADFRLRD